MVSTEKLLSVNVDVSVASEENMLLQISDLHVSVENTQILKGINLEINEGEVHAIMGPNGSGKSTLANVIAGRPGYMVTSGEILYKGESLLDLSPDQRALKGIFLAFQYPIELAGVRSRQFLKSAIDAVRQYQGDSDLSAREFDKLYRDNLETIQINPELMKRGVNEGFSGGEKKRSEMLQLSILDPKLAVLDETDSGLDIDSLKLVAEVVNRRRKIENSMILVTHYQRLLTYVVPDFVHVLLEGKISQSGDHTLAQQLEEKGYEWIKDSLGESVNI